MLISIYKPITGFPVIVQHPYTGLDCDTGLACDCGLAAALTCPSWVLEG